MSGSEYVEKKSSSVPNQTHSSLQPQRLPIPVQPQSDPQEQETHSIEEQLERASQFGYNGLDVPVNAPLTPPPPVQRKEGELGNWYQSPRVDPVLNGLNQLKVQRLTEEQYEASRQEEEQQKQPEGGTIQRFCSECALELSEKEEKQSVQTKLTVGEAGDKYEQEADTVAQTVVETIHSPQPQQPVQRQPTMQQNCSVCEADTSVYLQRQPDPNNSSTKTKEKNAANQSQRLQSLSANDKSALKQFLRSGKIPLLPQEVSLSCDLNKDTANLAEYFFCSSTGYNLAFPVDPDPLVCLDSGVTRSKPIFQKYQKEVIEPEYNNLQAERLLSQAQENTFFGQTIPGNITKTLRQKLLEAQSKAKRAMCLSGQDPNSFVLTKKIITYVGHSPAQEKAVDIDVSGQPYLMHEVTKKKPETDIDNEVREVYNRMAFWDFQGKSIIPNGITTVQRPPKSSTNTQRTWTNPNTEKQESITTGELYDLLQKESEAMQKYFNLLTKSDKDLAIEVEKFLGLNSAPAANITKLGLPTNSSSQSLQAFRQRISDDYRLLGGSKKQLEALAGKLIADSSKAPPSHHGDRPFEGDRPDRKPELGFLTLPKEVVVALTEVGLVWGAIDFGGGSGDVMHFDCRGIPNC